MLTVRLTTVRNVHSLMFVQFVTPTIPWTTTYVCLAVGLIIALTVILRPMSAMSVLLTIYYWAVAVF